MLAAIERVPYPTKDLYRNGVNADVRQPDCQAMDLQAFDDRRHRTLQVVARLHALTLDNFLMQRR